MNNTVLPPISKEDHERAKSMSRRKAETDRISNLLTAEERGRRAGIAEGRAEGIAEGRAIARAEARAKAIAEGIEEGIEEGIAFLINRMLLKGKSAEEISSDTDVPLEQVIRLKEKLNQSS